MGDANVNTAQAKSGGCCSSGCAKVAAVLLVLGGCAAVLFGALIVYGSSSGTAKLSEYFGMAAASDTATIAATFDDSLKADCDPQRLAQLIKAVPETYGALKGPRLNGFSFNDNYSNGVRHRNYKGTMEFERGDVPLEVNFVDDRLVTFAVHDAEAAKNLLATMAVPQDLTPYREKGERFLRAAMTEQVDEAFALMSEPLQKQIGKQGLATLCHNLASNGALASVTFIRAQPDPDEPSAVFLLYRVVAERGSAVGHVSFQFAGLNSYLIAFQIPSKVATVEDAAGGN